MGASGSVVVYVEVTAWQLHYYSNFCLSLYTPKGYYLQPMCSLSLPLSMQLHPFPFFIYWYIQKVVQCFDGKEHATICT
jgi:hypothetical protein